MSQDNVVSLGENMPQLVVSDSTGDVHVLPITLIRNIAAGRYKADSKVAELLAIAFLDNYDGD